MSEPRNWGFFNFIIMFLFSFMAMMSLGVLIYSSFDGGIKIPGFVKIVATVIVFLTLIFGTFFVYIVSNGYWFYPIEEIEKIQREDVNNPINIIKYLVL